MNDIEIILDIITLEIFEVIYHSNSKVDEKLNEQLTLF